jgi:hypothetical protein
VPFGFSFVEVDLARRAEGRFLTSIRRTLAREIDNMDLPIVREGTVTFSITQVTALRFS